MNNKKSGVLKFAVALTAFGAVACVAEANDGPYVGFEGGWNQASPQNWLTTAAVGQSVRYDNGYLAGLNFGYALPFGLRPEVALEWRRNEVRKLVSPGGVSSDAEGYQAAYTVMGNLWYDLKGPGLLATLHPYIGGGFGGTRLGLRNNNVIGNSVNGYDTVLTWQGGAGVGYDLTRNLSVSLDYRYLQTNRGAFDGTAAGVNARYRTNTAMFGIRYTFAAPAPAPAPVVAPPPPAPVPPPPPPPPVPVDGDDDGDGVPNSKDKCPGTPKGFKVDANGCIIEQTVVLRAVNFEFGKDTLTEPSKQTLDEVAAALAGQPSLNVEIAGHTDDRGSVALNQKLSQKRAESVRAYLVSKGAAAASLSAKGYGKTKPVASNATAEGRADNRRVEFVVLNKPANVKVETKDSTEASKKAAVTAKPAAKAKAAKAKPAEKAAQ